MAHNEPIPSAITTVTGTPELTRADDYVLAARFAIAAIVAATSVVMGYDALASLNARGHIASQWRWVWPVIVVAPELAAALAVVASQRRRENATWSWALLVIATAVSVAANVAAAPPDRLSQILHGAVPVVGFIQVKDLCIGIGKRLDATAAAAARAAVRQAAATPVAPPVPATPPPAPAPLPAATSLLMATAAPTSEATPTPPARPRPKTNTSATAKKTPKPPTAVPPHHVAKARAILAENPRATGETIGVAIGTKASYGRRVKQAALAGATA